MKLTVKNNLGDTGISIPPIVFGTSYLGNLYRELSYDEKKDLVKTWFDCVEKPVMIDTAGKYGAGLALESIGSILTDLGIKASEVRISNKLGWYRIPLTTDEPTFEPGIWKNLKHDAVQKISYEGIIECWKQGNDLLGGHYKADIVSVHDPDEYLMAADDEQDRLNRIRDILGAYKALFELREKGEVKAVGIGSKDWRVIRELYGHVKFDWVMFANSFTIMKHPHDLMTFINQLHTDHVGIINSAIFQSGFLTGGPFFDYRTVERDSEEGKFIYPWRDTFHKICGKYKVDPAEACIRFSLSHPAFIALALNTSKIATMYKNVESLQVQIPGDFWSEMKEHQLINPDYQYV